jgi:ligand-binding sensor domain-containing protein
VPSATQSEIVISTKSGIKVYNLQGNLIQEMDQQIPSESRLKDFLAEESMSKNFSIK